ncbi:MAG: tetratricopeptide repeat protein [Deltaproteobacteria bacterium]|nr:tetratricopeptide repeat protein [Deltaproteobacteria bacterium]
MRRLVVVVGLLALIGTGCVAQVRTVRRQAPMIELPPKTPVALVSIEVPKWVLDRAPSTYGHPEAMFLPALQRAFDGTNALLVDERELGWSMTIGPLDPDTGQLMHVDPRVPLALAPDQEFTAARPEHLPLGITHPLILGVQVIGWTYRKEMVGSTPRMRAETDIVYSLWTRDGREVETRRVKLSLVPSAGWRDAPDFVPARSHWWSWSGSQQYGARYTSVRPEETFGEAVSANAQAFAFPFHAADLHFGRQLDDSDEALKEGIDHLKAGRHAEARASFEALVQVRPELAGAHYDLGILEEIEGNDAAAIECFRRALKARPDTGLYARELQAVEARQAARLRPQLPGLGTPVL